MVLHVLEKTSTFSAPRTPNGEGRAGLKGRARKGVCCRECVCEMDRKRREEEEYEGGREVSGLND